MKTDLEASTELSPLNPIRVETALSRYPVHMLAKKGDINIELSEKDERGESSLKWRVTYNIGFGQPGPLAYKLDTLIVNRKIEEARRPIPRIIRLGSLREIAEQLELGGDTNCVKRALRQNASAFIIAKLRYKRPDGSLETLEADFTRYSVVFKGEKLPSGQEADAVYLILNDVYMQVINRAMTRPLDYDYLKELPPAPQRFYELLSFPMYGALKYDRHRAKLAYSEFCTYAPQTRYFDWEHARKQMAKVHGKHKRSGYISKVEFEPITDSNGQPDWLMFYTPGPKAMAEFRAFTKRGGPATLEIERSSPGSQSAVLEQIQLDFDHPKQKKAPAKGKPSKVAKLPPIAAELVERGVTEATAVELVQQHPPEFIQLQIEVFDWLKEKQDKKVSASPSGYLVKSIEMKYSVSAKFISKAEQKRRDEERQAKYRKEAEDARRKQQEAARVRDENLAVAAYRKALTPDELARHEADAIATASEEARQSLDTPMMARFRKTMIGQLLDEHIRQIVRNQQTPAPAI